MQRVKKDTSGFTLIELMVVIALITIMFSITIPRFSQSYFSDSTRKASSWIILNVKMLKEKAFQDQQRYILHVDIDTDKLWVSIDAMEEEDLLKAEQNAYTLSGGDRIVDVEFPVHGSMSYGTAEICFYPKGYSDKAIIHIADDSNDQKSLIIEPFLNKVKLIDDYIRFTG